jgi:protein import protein ZIM17
MSATAIRRSVWQTSQAAARCHHAPFRIGRRQLSTQRPLPILPSRLLQQRPSSRIINQIRCKSTQTADQKPLTDRTTPHSDATSTSEEIAARKAQEPAYEMTFTCRKCLERSSHRITKQAYHFGTTLITCPGCKNRHLISDHLKIFSDKSITLEDILREKGQFLKKGRLGEDGDIEFYDETSNEIGQKLAQEKGMQAQKRD